MQAIQDPFLHFKVNKSIRLERHGRQELLFLKITSLAHLVIIVPLHKAFWFNPQSIQSARLSLQSSELAPSAPSPASDCCGLPPALWVRGGGGRIRSLAGERAGGANSETLAL